MIVKFNNATAAYIQQMAMALNTNDVDVIRLALGLYKFALDNKLRGGRTIIEAPNGTMHQIIHDEIPQ